jgi:hypothetical protein
LACWSSAVDARSCAGRRAHRRAWPPRPGRASQATGRRRLPVQGLRESLSEADIDGLPRTLLADAGYFSADNINAVTSAGIDPLIATGRLRHGQEPAPAPRGRIPKHLTPKQRMARKLRTKNGKTGYARRKAIVEPVFGQIQVAQHGDRLRLRGKVKAEFEWFFHLGCHNFRKLAGSGWTARMATS